MKFARGIACWSIAYVRRALTRARIFNHVCYSKRVAHRNRAKKTLVARRFALLRDFIRIYEKRPPRLLQLDESRRRNGKSPSDIFFPVIFLDGHSSISNRARSNVYFFLFSRTQNGCSRLRVRYLRAVTDERAAILTRRCVKSCAEDLSR